MQTDEFVPDFLGVVPFDIIPSYVPLCVRVQIAVSKDYAAMVGMFSYYLVRPDEHLVSRLEFKSNDQKSHAAASERDKVVVGLVWFQETYACIRPGIIAIQRIFSKAGRGKVVI